jgi:hypothetical protein
VLRGQIEYQINSINPFTDFVRGAVWGTGVNNVWTTNTLAVDEGICLSVLNNNPTSSHTVTITVFNTLDQRATTYLNGPPFRWGQSTLVQNGGGTISGPNFSSIPVTINAQSVTGLYVRTGGAARMSFVFSGSMAAAGNPDTADIFITHNVTGFACGVAVLPASINVQTINQIPTKSQTGGIPIEIQQVPLVTASWTSATPINTALTANSQGFSNAFVTFRQPGSISAGQATFESSDDGMNWFGLQCTSAGSNSGNNAQTNFVIASGNSFNLGNTTLQSFTCPTAGTTQFRVRLNITIAGAGTEVVNITLSAVPISTNIEGSILLPQNIVGTATFDNAGNPVTTIVAVKGLQTNLYGWYVGNTTAAVCWLQILPNGATLGTTAPTMTLMVPANGAANLGLTMPINLQALNVAATTTASGNTTCAMSVNLWYQ